MICSANCGGHFKRTPGSRAAGEEFESWALRSVRVLDRTLAGQPYLVGARITMADIFAYGALDYGLRFAARPSAKA